MGSLNVILNKLYQNYAQIFTPADMMTIQRMSISFVKSGWIQIPSDYVQFLTLSDGLCWNGIELFGICEHERRDTVFLHPTLKEKQEDKIFQKVFFKTLLVGRGPEELILYSNETHSYHIVDRDTLDVMVKLPRLADVLYFYGVPKES